MIALLFVPLLLFILLLFLAGSAQFGLILDKTIKLSDLTGLMATTLVAVVLQYIVQRRGKATDSEKVLLTSQVSTVLADLLGLRDLLSPLVAQALKPDVVIIVVQNFDSLAEELSTLRFCIEKSHCRDLVIDYKWIEREFLEYKAAVTGGNFPVTPITFAALAKGSGHRNQMDRDLRLLIFRIAKE